MSDYLYLDADEIRDYEYKKLTGAGGLESKAHNALQTYTSRLNSISSEGFNADDDSTAHEVIDELLNQMTKITNVTDEVEKMIDDLTLYVQSMIIDKEDRLAGSLEEDLSI